MTTRTIMAITAVAGLAAVATAQDSVSNITNQSAGGEGDAPGLYTAADQVNRYVVDPALITTEWGKEFNLFNLMKAPGFAGSEFENLQGSAQYISRLLIDSNFAPEGYAFWTNAPGQGVDGNNDTPTGTGNMDGTLTPEGSSLQFGVGYNFFQSFAAPDGIMGAIVNLDPNNPNRLYVERVIAASNGASAANDDGNSNYGFGAVDASGNIVFRVDTFGANGTNRVSGNNIFNVDLNERTGLNPITGSGAGDPPSINSSIINSSETIVTPNIIPQEVSTLAGGRFVSHTFSGQYLFDNGTVGTASDISTESIRAQFQYAAGDLLGVGNGTSGTGAYQTFSATAPGAADTIVAFPVNDTGAVVGGIANSVFFTLPASGVIDPVDAYTLPSPNGRFFHYESQSPFGGPNANHAIGTDIDGNVLVAAAVRVPDDVSGSWDGIDFNAEEPDYPNNAVSSAITVARQDSNGNIDWVVAAWTAVLDSNNDGAGLNDPTALGKPVFDGPNGQPVGYLATYWEYSFEFLQNSFDGPALSSPAFDAAGNIYFTSPVWFPSDANDDFKDANEMRVALIRGVYTQLDGGGFGYKLDVMLQQGDVFTGPNSGRDFQIGFITIPDSNSLASGAFASGNVRQTAFLNQPVTNDPADESNLGGLVISASMDYDANGDGEFTFPSEEPNVEDEGYNMLFYIQPVGEVITGPVCKDGCTDINADGVTDISDLLILLAQYNNPLPGGFDTNDPARQVDITCDDVVDISDLLALLAQFNNPASAACN